MIARRRFFLFLHLHCRPSNFFLPLLLLSIAPLFSSSGLVHASSTARQSSLSNLEAKALDLLTEIEGQARSLRLAENRLRILSLCASLRLERDPERARALISEVQRDLVSALTQLEAVALSPNASSSFADESRQSLVNVRAEMLRLLAARESTAALDFLRATRTPSPAQSSDEMRLEQHLASSMAQRDSKSALALARESLARVRLNGSDSGVTHDLLKLIARVHKKDAQAASDLADEVAARLNVERLVVDLEATGVVTEMLLYSSASRTSGAVRGATKPLLSERTHRQLLDAVAQAALKSLPSGGRGLAVAARYVDESPWTSTIGRLLPEIDKYIPGRGAELRNKLSALGISLRSLRDAAGDAEERRSSSLDETESQSGAESKALTKEAARAQVEEARSYLAQAGEGREVRADALVKLAGALMAAGENEDAKRAMDEASMLVVGQRAQSYEGLRAMLSVARGWAEMDAGRGFNVAEVVIGQINELMTAATTLEGFEVRGLTKDGEMVVAAPDSSLQLMEEVKECAKAIADLSLADFERAKGVVGHLQREEARIAGWLALAQEVLDAKSKANVPAEQKPSIAAATNLK